METKEIEKPKIVLTKKQEVHNIFSIKDKDERIKALVEYTKKNFGVSTQCKANILNEATVIFDGGLL